MEGFSVQTMCKLLGLRVDSVVESVESNAAADDSRLLAQEKRIAALEAKLELIAAWGSPPSRAEK